MTGVGRIESSVCIEQSVKKGEMIKRLITEGLERFSTDHVTPEVA